MRLKNLKLFGSALILTCSSLGTFTVANISSANAQNERDNSKLSATIEPPDQTDADTLTLPTDKTFFIAQNVSQQLQGAAGGAIERYLENNVVGVRHDFSNNWGNTIRKRTGVRTVTKEKCHRVLGKKVCHNVHGIENTYSNLNHGLWVRGTANLENEFDLDIRNFRVSNGTISFDIIPTSLVRAKPEIRSYSHGARLASARIDSRTRTQITLNATVNVCRAGNRINWKTNVVSRNLKIKDFYLDRIGNIGGYSAKVLGDTIKAGYDEWLRYKGQTYASLVQKNTLKAITHDGSVTAYYTRLTGLPRCQ